MLNKALKFKMINKIYYMYPKVSMKGMVRNTECCEISQH